MNDWRLNPSGWSTSVAPLASDQRSEVIRLAGGVEAGTRHNYRTHLLAEARHARRQMRDYPDRAAEFRAAAEAYDRALELLGTCWPDYGAVLASDAVTTEEADRGR